MEIYVKGKYEHGVGTAAYVAVSDGNIVTQGSKRLGTEFTLGGVVYLCDQFSTEIAAAICGIARCGADEEIRVLSNNKTVVKWLDRGEEPEARHNIVDQWRIQKMGRKVTVEWIPRYDNDPMGNPWNKICNDMATKELLG